MKKYYTSLIVVTIVMVIAAFCTLWFGSGIFQTILPFLPLYFAVVTGLQHYAVVKSFDKDPRTFVKNFLGLTIGSLFLHLAVLVIYVLVLPRTAKIFIIAFCICYFVYLAFETTALVLYVRRKQKGN